MSATTLTPGAPDRRSNVPGVMKSEAVARALGRRRERINLLVKALCVTATLIGLALLASILFTLLWNGLAGLSLNVFVSSTKPPGSNGGLANAIVGTLIQTGIGTAIGTPIGLMVGTYLAEYSRGEPMGGFSGIAGSLALAVIVIPIVVRTTEDMLQLIPTSLREAAIALGAPKWKVITLICYRAAMDGIVTGVLLAVARIAGETAPLLFTSLGNLNWSVNMAKPMASLPVTIYQYAGSAFDDWVQLAWVAALLITVGVLAINIAARFVFRRRT